MCVIQGILWRVDHQAGQRLLRMRGLHPADFWRDWFLGEYVLSFYSFHRVVWAWADFTLCRLTESLLLSGVYTLQWFIMALLLSTRIFVDEGGWRVCCFAWELSDVRVSFSFLYGGAKSIISSERRRFIPLEFTLSITRFQVGTWAEVAVLDSPWFLNSIESWLLGAKLLLLLIGDLRISRSKRRVITLANIRARPRCPSTLIHIRYMPSLSLSSPPHITQRCRIVSNALCLKIMTSGSPWRVAVSTNATIVDWYVIIVLR